MSSLAFAFEITEDDIENVLRTEHHRLLGRAISTPPLVLAEELITEIDADRIADQALQAGTDLDDQTEAAYAAIADQLVALDILRPTA